MVFVNLLFQKPLDEVSTSKTLESTQRDTMKVNRTVNELYLDEFTWTEQPTSMLSPDFSCTSYNQNVMVKDVKWSNACCWMGQRENELQMVKIKAGFFLPPNAELCIELKCFLLVDQAAFLV